MSWKERLRTGITLVSPSGLVFHAKWRGDDVQISKRINRTAHPDQDGESAQDLGMNSADFPLTFFFDGKDCDLEAQRFSRAIPEKGVWSVVHPVLGLLKIQPVKFTIRMQPIESGNVVEVQSDWFEPAADTPALSADPAAAVQAAVEELNTSIFEEIAAQATSILAKVQSFTAAVKSLVRKIRSVITAVANIQNTIIGTINAVANFTRSVITSVAGAVISLIQFPGLFAGTVRSQIESFKNMGANLMNDFQEAVSSAGSDSGVTSNKARELKSAAAANMLSLSAIAGGMALVVTSTPPETRAEALAALKAWTAYIADMEASIESAAKATANLPIEDQITGRAASAEAVRTLNAAVIRYLMYAAFNAKTERWITLEKPESPLLIAIREYGAGADNADEAFNLFCRSNDLHGRELLLLDRGREVLVYQ
jgi:prophage DNA circulation protein